MSWGSDLRKLRARSWRERALLLEALLSIGLARVAIRALPFRRVAAMFHLEQGESTGSLPLELVDRAARVGWAVRTASIRVPRQSTCLTQGLAGMAMLRRRDIPGTLTLGVAKGRTQSEPIEAHAWLRCGDTILTGGSGHVTFTVISSFRMAPTARARPAVGRMIDTHMSTEAGSRDLH